MSNSEYIPVLLVKYDNDADLDVEYPENGDPYVTNHDEVPKTDIIRPLRKETVDEYNMDVVTEDDPMWRDEFADLERGDEIELASNVDEVDVLR